MLLPVKWNLAAAAEEDTAAADAASNLELPVRRSLLVLLLMPRLLPLLKLRLLPTDRDIVAGPSFIAYAMCDFAYFPDKHPFRNVRGQSAVELPAGVLSVAIAPGAERSRDASGHPVY